MRKKRWRKDLKEINVEQENVVKGLEDVEKDEKWFPRTECMWHKKRFSRWLQCISFMNMRVSADHYDNVCI